MNQISSTKAELEAELKAAGQKGRECPFHDDKNPSVSIKQGDDGKWRFKCFAASCGFSGDAADVRARAAGVPVANVLKDFGGTTAAEPQKRPEGPVIKTPVYKTLEDLKRAADLSGGAARVKKVYEYTHPVTMNRDVIVFRLEQNDGAKSFRQGHQNAEGFVLKAPAGLLPLYNRGRITAAPRVVVVEGEKCVHALHDIGIVATTSAGGSNGANKADWTPLAGKEVIIWPDNDLVNPKTGKSSGAEYAKDVIAQLEQLEPRCSVYLVDTNTLELGEKEDCVEYIAKHAAAHRKMAVEAVLEFAEPIGAAAELKAEIEEAISGKRKPLPMPWSYTAAATRALQAGKVLLLCGPPGATKSFWLLELMAYLFRRGAKVALMELEETRTYHLRRGVAQSAGEALFTRDEWCEENPAEARRIVKEQETFAAGFGQCIHTAPVETLTPESMVQWVEGRVAAGCKVIGIDPITAMQAGGKQWETDHKFLIAAKRAITAAGATLILVTHPKKGEKSGDLDDLSGGSTYPRFAQTVLWLMAKDLSPGLFQGTAGADNADYNRILQVRKARESFGQNVEIGYFFDSKTFRSIERGPFQDS